jgi:hypothetical protein
MVGGMPSARSRRALQTVYPQIMRGSMPSERLCNIAVVPRRDRPAKTHTLRTLKTRRHLRRAGLVGLVLAALLTALAVAGPAGAAQSCGRKVIDDWYDDGRVDGTYPLHCYDDAIEILPRDVRDYSSAKEDIQRAMTNALRGESAPPTTKDPTRGGGTPTTPGDDEPPTTTAKTETNPNSEPKDEVDHPEAGPTVDTEESASSVPIPLLVLAGLALLLVAGGSAGYLVRRFRGPQGPPPAT